MLCGLSYFRAPDIGQSRCTVSASSARQRMCVRYGRHLTDRDGKQQRRLNFTSRIKERTRTQTDSRTYCVQAPNKSSSPKKMFKQKSTRYTCVLEEFFYNPFQITKLRTALLDGTLAAQGNQIGIGQTACYLFHFSLSLAASSRIRSGECPTLFIIAC